MAAVRMFVEKFRGVVLIEENDPAAIEQRARDAAVPRVVDGRIHGGVITGDGSGVALPLLEEEGDGGQGASSGSSRSGEPTADTPTLDDSATVAPAPERPPDPAQTSARPAKRRRDR